MATQQQSNDGSGILGVVVGVLLVVMVGFLVINMNSKNDKVSDINVTLPSVEAPAMPSAPSGN